MKPIVIDKDMVKRALIIFISSLMLLLLIVWLCEAPARRSNAGTNATPASAEALWAANSPINTTASQP